MPFQEGHKLSGSRKGKPNRLKRDAREAIDLVVGGNAPELNRWIKQVAGGLREPKNPDGTPGKWIIKPDPGRAYDMVSSLFEYQRPKLSRIETVRDKPKGIVIDSSQLTTEEREEYRQRILAAMRRESEPLLEQQPATMLEPVGLATAQMVDIIEDKYERTSVME